MESANRGVILRSTLCVKNQPFVVSRTRISIISSKHQPKRERHRCCATWTRIPEAWPFTAKSCSTSLLNAHAPCVALQVGLNYICATAERFFAVGAVLGNMVVAQAQIQDLPSQRLLKHIIRCYLRLSDNPRCGTGWRL